MTTTTYRLSIAFRAILFVVFAIGIIMCVFLIARGELTSRESAMLGILVTILSVLASWLVTHLYSTSQYDSAIVEVREEYRNNLRTYALKAAEKVNNLSNELNKLSIYLEEELNYTDYRSSDEELLAKEERIESAIHLIRTLKSVNDTALSDWEGVIGEELDEHREEQQERQDELKALIERVESFVEDRREIAGARRDADTLKDDVEKLRHQLRVAMFQLSDTTIPKRIRKKEPKQSVSTECPVCHAQIEYRQRSNARSFKQVPCRSCGKKLVSTYSPSHGFQLKPREEQHIEVKCPKCETPNNSRLDNFPGSSVLISCSSCKDPFRVYRTLDGLDVRSSTMPTPRISKADSDLTEEIIDRVRSALPPQPWPTGVHHELATRLVLPPSLVSRAIQKLIRDKVVFLQIDGVVYVPREERAT
jgi:hypothetical protein